MKQKIFLIAGCSHVAGSEIDGTQDSLYNRQHSFGNLLANKLEYKPVNIALCGSTNSCITRSVQEWFYDNYKADEMDVFVLVAYTDSSRIEAPHVRPTWYREMNPHVDWFSKSSVNFLQINNGWHANNREESLIMPLYQNFMARCPEFMETFSANLVLQTQYFLKYNNIPYLFCNSGFQFTKSNKFLDFYMNIIDTTRYINHLEYDESFYKKYKDLGYHNQKAKYFHHDEEPHRLYAEVLYNFIKNEGIL
jgi:hypothetical protein